MSSVPRGPVLLAVVELLDTHRFSALSFLGGGRGLTPTSASLGRSGDPEFLCPDTSSLPAPTPTLTARPTRAHPSPGRHRPAPGLPLLHTGGCCHPRGHSCRRVPPTTSQAPGAVHPHGTAGRGGSRGRPAGGQEGLGLSPGPTSLGAPALGGPPGAPTGCSACSCPVLTVDRGGRDARAGPGTRHPGGSHSRVVSPGPSAEPWGGGRSTRGTVGGPLPTPTGASWGRVPAHGAPPRAPTAAGALPAGGRLRGRHTGRPHPITAGGGGVREGPRPLFFFSPGLALPVTDNLIIRLRASLAL